jgi:hypothetical protein
MINTRTLVSLLTAVNISMCDWPEPEEDKQEEIPVHVTIPDYQLSYTMKSELPYSPVLFYHPSFIVRY